MKPVKGKTYKHTFMHRQFKGVTDSLTIVRAYIGNQLQSSVLLRFGSGLDIGMTKRIIMIELSF